MPRLFLRFVSCALFATMTCVEWISAREAPRRGPNAQDVLVFANLGRDAEKIPRPTPEKPAYYVAMAGGFRREGPPMGGEEVEKVTADDVWKVLHGALARQGYLPATKTTPKASLLVVFHWGVMNPDFVDPGPMSQPIFLNAQKMGDLIGASRVDRHLSSEYETARERATEDRYMVVVSAFDFEAATAERREKKLVWRARMSVPSLQTTLADALLPMIASGASFFGRDTPQAQELKWERANVEVGELETVSYLPAPSPDPKDAAKK